MLRFIANLQARLVPGVGVGEVPRHAPQERQAQGAAPLRTAIRRSRREAPRPHRPCRGGPGDTNRAGRRNRVGPAIWQSFYFSIVGGVAFLALLPLARPLVALGRLTADVTLAITVNRVDFTYSGVATLTAAATAAHA